MIKYSIVEDGNAAVLVVQELLHVTAFVVAHPLKIAIRNFLRHGPAVEVVVVHLDDVEGRLLGVVQRAHQLVVGAGVSNACVADATADVRLDHPIHLRIGNQRDRPVDVFEERVPRDMRRANRRAHLGRVQLVLIKRLVSKRLEHVSQQANVAQNVELHVFFEIRAEKVVPHVLGMCVVSL